MTVLVIDDDQAALIAFRHDFETFLNGEQVICVTNLKDALTVIAMEQNIASVWLDLMLPGVEGAEAVTIVKDALRAARINAPVLSYSGDPKLREDAIQRNARKFFDKKDIFGKPEELKRYSELSDRIGDKLINKVEQLQSQVKSIGEEMDQMQQSIFYGASNLSSLVAELRGKLGAYEVEMQRVSGENRELKDKANKTEQFFDLVKKIPGGWKSILAGFLALSVALNGISKEAFLVIRGEQTSQEAINHLLTPFIKDVPAKLLPSPTPVPTPAAIPSPTTSTPN